MLKNPMHHLVTEFEHEPAFIAPPEIGIGHRRRVKRDQIEQENRRGDGKQAGKYYFLASRKSRRKLNAQWRAAYIGSVYRVNSHLLTHWLKNNPCQHQRALPVYEE